MRWREASKSTRRLTGVALIAALLLALGGLAACGDDDDQEPAEPVQTAEQTDTTTTEDQGGGEQTTTTGGDDDEGEQLFAQHCETCHGPEGEGGAGPSLQNPQLKDEQRVRNQIVNGGGGMPPFGDQLSQAEIDDLTIYVTQELANE